MTLARLIAKNKVPEQTSTPGLRELEERDLPAVGELLSAYLARFDLVPLMSDEEVRHNFWSGRGIGEPDSTTGKRQGQVTWCYVVEVSYGSTSLSTLILTRATAGPRNTSHYGLLLLLFASIYGSQGHTERHSRCSLPVLHRNRATCKRSRYQLKQRRYHLGQGVARDARAYQTTAGSFDLGCLDLG